MTLTAEKTRRVKSAIAECDRVLATIREKVIHRDLELEAEYVANKARLEAMLAA
jgi:hypothetical protein